MLLFLLPLRAGILTVSWLRGTIDYTYGSDLQPQLGYKKLVLCSRETKLN